jgi:rhodanese-related sulfurtransferase
MTDHPATSVGPTDLKSMLHDGGEIALLDVREAGQFGESHLLFATPLPFSRLELDAYNLLPRRNARIVICDDGASGVATVAAARLRGLGRRHTRLARRRLRPVPRRQRAEQDAGRTRRTRLSHAAHHRTGSRANAGRTRELHRS